MGGLGSGHPMWKGKKSTVEACKELDIGSWQRKGYFDNAPVSLTFSWNRGDRSLGSIGVAVLNRNSIRLHYDSWIGDNRSNAKSLDYPIPVSWTECNFGGKRPWFICPGMVNGQACRRRVAKLYLDGSYFLCRHCHDLTYETRQTGKQDQALKKCQKIREQLGGSANMTTPFPPRPKGMHFKTYFKIQHEYYNALDQYNASLMASLDRINGFLSRIGNEH